MLILEAFGCAFGGAFWDTLWGRYARERALTEWGARGGEGGGGGWVQEDNYGGLLHTHKEDIPGPGVQGFGVLATVAGGKGSDSGGMEEGNEG